jgi:hypothetical protein
LAIPSAGVLIALGVLAKLPTPSEPPELASSVESQRHLLPLLRHVPWQGIGEAATLILAFWLLNLYARTFPGLH